MSVPSSSIALREFCAGENERIRQQFDASLDGRATVRARAALIDAACARLWHCLVAPAGGGPASFCLVAMGGFGRATLFPASDIDLLFLCADERIEAARRETIRSFCQELWDLRLRVSPATRTLPECGLLHYDNLEFTIALLDSRYLVGDEDLFARLRQKILPELVLRERQVLVQRLAEVTRARQAKFGNTIFHLEPNVKDTPGGLRDYHVATWLSLISRFEKDRIQGPPESFFPPALRDETSRALDFLFALRCFLHYRAGRDDNVLTWEAQDEAASLSVGMSPGCVTNTAHWMRSYFRHARAISRLTAHLLDEVPPARSGLYQQYQQWRSRVSNADFSVSHGRIYLQQPSATADSSLLLRLFAFMARHGFKLSLDAELRIARALPPVAAEPPRGAELWSQLREILIGPHAADALRAMHAIGLLVVLLPELRCIDSLVIRDFYHRYTVDEHSFTAIQNVHELRQAKGAIEQGYVALLNEIDRSELLFLALLLHDVGKGVPGGGHVEAGMHLVDSALARLQLGSEGAELVRFLVQQHLQISMSLLRRDIFDPETIRTLAERVGTTERLKMLCLLTYADVKAVNPEALTPWKAEDIWHLYVQTANYLDHSVDEDRYKAELPQPARAQLERLPTDRRAEIEAFVTGLPRRYLLTHSAEAMERHAEMASRVGKDPVQLSLELNSHLHRLTVITSDRPGLFATITGVMTAWGMDIVKADAFSNAAGNVLDTFGFLDPFRTLELNPPERERFKRSVTDVLLGDVQVEDLLAARERSRKQVPYATEPPRITFDTDTSSRSTILEIVAPDRSGLLYTLASVLAENGCNLEVALVDTQGRLAVDVFYVTAAGSRLDSAQQQQLRDALLQELTANA